MLPDHLKKLSRASRDIAEARAEYPDAKDLFAAIRAAFDYIKELQTSNHALQGRINEIRNNRDELLTDIQQVVKKFDFAFRAV